MRITEKTWIEYITRLAKINETAGQKMADYIARHGTQDTDALIAYAQALVQKYGEGSAELACQMYDAMAEASGADVPPAVPAEPADYNETAKMVNATKQSPPQLQGGVSRLVKRAGADTTLKNAIRDGAEWAWVPYGDTCPFCITLASRGWQRASKKALKGDHAEHIHTHCNCEYAVRFDSRTTVAGYDPEKYLKQYEDYGGDINAMRRAQYAKNKDKINAQKRAAYAARKERSGPIDVLKEYLRTATPGIGSITFDEGYDRTRHAAEIETAQWLHYNLGGNIVLLNESNIQGQKMPDYLWREHLWELKIASSVNSADLSMRHALKQIADNPGGIVLSLANELIDIEQLEKQLTRRFLRGSVETIDIVLKQGNDLLKILRYKK